MVRTHKKTFQYYEVHCDGTYWNERYPPRRFFRRGKDALQRALAYARQLTVNSPVTSTVDAVYRQGATGQSTTPVAGFQRGHETFATYHPPLAALPPSGKVSGAVNAASFLVLGDATPNPTMGGYSLDWEWQIVRFYADSVDVLDKGRLTGGSIPDWIENLDAATDARLRKVVLREVRRWIQSSDFMHTPHVRPNMPIEVYLHTNRL